MRLVPSESIRCFVCAPSNLNFKAPAFSPEPPRLRKGQNATCFKASELWAAARLLEIIAVKVHITPPSTQVQISITYSPMPWQSKLELLLSAIV